MGVERADCVSVDVRVAFPSGELKAKPGAAEERSVRSSLHPLRQRYSFPAVIWGVWGSEVSRCAALASLYIL